MLGSIFRATVVYIICTALVSASPIASTLGSSALRGNKLATRALGNEPQESPNTSLKIWIPLLVLGLVVLGCGAIYWKKRRGRRGQTTTVNANSTTRVASSNNTGGVRELTAAQLAGESESAAHPPQPRRTRRPRRTPSQISTTSLPEYMKEPGELELVIVRGPEELEDEMDREGMIRQRTIIMPSVGEAEDGQESTHSRSRSDSTIASYDRMPDTPVDTPLLDGPETANSDRLDIPNNSASRRSFDSLMSGEDTSNHASPLSISRTRSAEPAVSVPIGEAPPYFEVVDLGSDLPPSLISPEPAVVTPAARSSQNPNRLSSFRALFRAKQAPPPVLTADSILPATTPGHRRADSTFSNISSDMSHSRGASLALSATQSRVSQAGSRISLTAFRTLSRQRSTNTLASSSSRNINNSSNHLNSASMISLGSISAPLSHTLVRTPFTYPKAGPTPEQLKAISTKDAYRTFGVPYGEDSIAFAERSRSRVELGMEDPPQFDFDAAGPSRLTTEAGTQSPISAPPIPGASSSSGEEISSPSFAPIAFKFPQSSVSSRAASALSRSESRASSVSYATALNGDDGYDTAAEGDETESLSDGAENAEREIGTPRSMTTQHLPEATDDTVRPGSLDTVGRRASTSTVGRRESVLTVGDGPRV